MKSHALVASVSLLMFCAVETLAADFYYRATVSRILVSDTDYGGCMIETSPAPRTEDARCTTKFVSFDCVNSTGIGKSAAANKLSAAQLAFVTGREVGILVSENSDGSLAKVDGHCLSSRVDNF